MPQIKGVILGRPESTPGPKGGTRHKFSILTEDGQKMSMTTFDNKAFEEVKDGNTYLLTFTEKPNPKNARYPFRNLEGWKEVEGITPAEPQPTRSRDDYQRSKEQTSLENCLIAASGDFDKAVELYGKVQAWEADRKAVQEKEQPKPANKKAAPKEQPPKPDAPEGMDMPSYETLRKLNMTRYDAEGNEQMSTNEMAALCAETYDGKKVRQLSEVKNDQDEVVGGDILEFIKLVEAKVEEKTESEPPKKAAKKGTKK